MNTLQIFGAIGLNVTSDSVASQLATMDRAAPLLVEINSEGGSVSEGIAIFNMLSSWPAGVETKVIGWALSVASVILMAGSVRRVHETSLVMVHAPWTTSTGNAEQMRQTATTLDQVAEAMRRAYMRSGQPEAVVSAWLDGSDHWFTSDQALALGLATEVIAAATAPAAAPANAQGCMHRVPPSLTAKVHAMIQASATPATPASAAGQEAALAAETQRCSDISAALQAAASHHSHDSHLQQQLPALIRSCLADRSCTVQAAKGRFLDLLGQSAQPIAGHYYIRSDSEARQTEFVAACTQALMMRAGLQVKEPHPALRDVQRMSVVAMAERVLSMNGRSVSSMSRAEIIQAALTTSDFAKLLSNVANKSLRQGYEQAPATHAPWTAEREVTDFKKNTLAQLSGAPSFLEVPESAEYKFGALSDSASEFQLATYGRVLTLTRQALINDDMGAFTSLPAAFGAAARRLEADKVYALLQSTANLPDGVPLFHASRGNLSAVSETLAVRSLGNARAGMRKQRGIAPGGSDTQGDFIDPQPAFLIVPVALETTAESIISSLVDFRVTSLGSVSAEQVSWIKNLTLIADPRLDAVSETAWYLATSPMQIEGIARAYLQGEQRPALFENEEFIRDAVSYKARMDFASGVIDPKGLYKNVGA